MRNFECRYFIYTDNKLKANISERTFLEIKKESALIFRGIDSGEFEVGNADSGWAIFDKNNDVRVLLWNGDIIKEVFCQK